MLIGLEEICGIVEKDVEDSGTASAERALPEDSFAARRAELASVCDALPDYGSDAFWARIAASQEEAQALPLEVLVKVLREAVARKDETAQRRLFEIIVARLQVPNEQWVKQALASTRLSCDERLALAADLYADLCELLLRFLKDPKQHFWEEHFLHSLRFARKHVYESFMRREGHWHKLTPGPGYRVPQALLESLEWKALHDEAESDQNLADERAELALQAVEQTDMVALLVRLPVQLRAVVWLTFWGDYTHKTIGRLLGVSERTVRNRLRAALERLREFLKAEKEVFDGENG